MVQFSVGIPPILHASQETPANNHSTEPSAKRPAFLFSCLQNPDYDVWPALCTKAKVSFYTFRDTSHDFPTYHTAAVQPYFGLHFNPFLSLHYRTLASRFAKNTEINPGKENNIGKRFEDILFLQIGNSGIHRYRIKVGHIPPAFGINQSFISVLDMYFFDLLAFYPESNFGTMLTVDNKINLRMDLSLSDVKKISKQDSDIEKMQVFAARIMTDVDAWDGTRLFFSYLSHEDHSMVESGLLNIRPNGDTFRLEWIRQSDNKNQPFKNNGQLFSIGYLKSQKNGDYVLTEYDTANAKYRLFRLGYIYRPWDLLRLGLNLHFKKDIEPVSDIYTIISTEVSFEI